MGISLQARDLIKEEHAHFKRYKEGLIEAGSVRVNCKVYSHAPQKVYFQSYSSHYSLLA